MKKSEIIKMVEKNNDQTGTMACAFRRAIIRGDLGLTKLHPRCKGKEVSNA